MSVRDLWLARSRQHTTDSYAGVRMEKLPEDLRTYEHLLWETRANLVVEIGSRFGGSALWFRDRLRAMKAYGRIDSVGVISIEIDNADALDAVRAADPSYAETITFLEADIRDPELPGRVATAIPLSARCFVVEDSAHVYDTTLAALRGFAGFVTVGGYFVVEDGYVDVEAMRPDESWPRGVLPAIADWLSTPEGQAFRVRRDLELYGISANPGGFLQRTR